MIALEEHLIQRIHPEVSRLWAVSDVDGLFRGEEVTRLLGEKEAQVVVFEEPLAFRYLYEHEIRPRIEETESGCFVILLDSEHDDFLQLPADIYEACQRFSVTVGDLFPSLSRSVLRELSPAILSRIWKKRDLIPSASLGDRDSADLILRLGYKVEISVIETMTDLVAQLLPLHVEGHRLTEQLALRLASAVKETYSGEGRVADIILRPSAFWGYLGQEWKRWLIGDSSELHERSGLSLKFTDNKLRVWMDNVFEDGFLKRVTLPSNHGELPSPWCRVGIENLANRSAQIDLQAQRTKLLDGLPDKDSNYQDWFQFADRYSVHVADCFGPDSDSKQIEFFWSDLWPAIDNTFSEWMSEKFDSHHNLPPTRPVVVHQIPKLLARSHAKGRKVALLVFDGLSLSQWKTLRYSLEPRLDGVSIVEDACLTHVPTITNVCRQSIYAGELPVFFDSTIGRTDCDLKRWKAFWNSASINKAKASLLLVDGHEKDLEAVRQTLEQELTAVGVTVKMPDETMHGATMGWKGMFSQLALWAGGDFIAPLIEECLSADYDVWLTSDHGNIEAIGTGNPKEGVLVDRSGQRMRIYPNETIRSAAIQGMSERAVKWESFALGQSYLPLIHKGRGAFVKEGDTIVCHGGTSLDEVIVPFIQFSKSALA